MLKSNSIRIKLFLINLVFILFFCAVVSLVSLLFIYPEYYRYESKKTAEEVLQLRNLINGEIESLDLYCRDWALWTDTWNYVQDGNREYEESNLGEQSLDIGKLSFFMFYDFHGDLVHAGWIDPEDGSYVNARNYVNSALSESLLYSGRHEYTERVKKGIIQSADGRASYIYSSRNVLKSDLSGPSAGTLIAGRVIGGEVLFRLSNSHPYRISIRNDHTGEAVLHKDISEEFYFVDKTNAGDRKKWRISVPFKLSERDDFVYFVFEHELNIINQGLEMMILISFIIILSFIILLMFQQVWLIRTVVRPVSNLTGYIEIQTKALGDEFKPLINSSNEIDRLSESFHILLNKLFEQNRQLFSQASTDALTGLFKEKCCSGVAE